MWCSARFNTRAATIFTVCKLSKKCNKLIGSYMYADGTNLFLTHKDIGYLFETVNL